MHFLWNLRSYCFCNIPTAFLFLIIQGGEPEYLEQPSRTDVSRQLKEDSVRAITKAFTEQEDKGPEAIMHMVRNANCKILYLRIVRTLVF